MTSILLIEDDPIMGESLLQRFELEGLQVSWCRRLSEAREALSFLPSAVVSDVRLPDGLATEWFVSLPATVRALPWFFLTGYGSVNDAVAAVRAGAREYLTKPFDIERLVAKIRDAVDLSVALDDDALTVSLIPHTLARTNLRDRTPGDAVNLEVDLVARYVERLLAARAASEDA